MWFSEVIYLISAQILSNTEVLPPSYTHMGGGGGGTTGRQKQYTEIKPTTPKTTTLPPPKKNQNPKQNGLEDLQQSREPTIAPSLTPVSNSGVQIIIYILVNGNIFCAYAPVTPKIPHNYHSYFLLIYRK